MENRNEIVRMLAVRPNSFRAIFLGGGVGNWGRRREDGQGGEKGGCLSIFFR